MLLLKDRTLNIAILISAFWHILFILSFNPVFTTGHIIKHSTSISFLGDILENVGNNITEDSQSALGLNRPQDQVKHARDFHLNYILTENKIDESGSDEAGFVRIRQQDKEFLYPLAGQVSLKLNTSPKKETAKINLSDFFIKGKARDRMIIYKPDLDKAIILPSDFNSDFRTDIKFRISKYGFVRYAECITSSGFSYIDQAAIRYVRKWQFVPAGEDGQEGVVRVSFK